jgi:hypothetical protein
MYMFSIINSKQHIWYAYLVVSIVLFEASESTHFICGQLHVPKWSMHIDLALRDVPDAIPLIMSKNAYPFLVKKVVYTL